MSARRLLVAAAGGLLAAGLLAGCGVPTSGDPTTIPAGEVPYGLASPTPTGPTGGPPETMLVETGVYLITPDDVLVARGRELPAGPLASRLETLLAQLAAGPSSRERAEELSTRLPPEVELAVTDVSGGTVTIDIAGPVDAPTGIESRLAVAQIVLTATSIPDVRAVLITRQGEKVDAPLPDGQLTSVPLTADDYAAFLTAPVPAPTATPPSAVPEAEATSVPSPSS